MAMAGTAMAASACACTGLRGPSAAPRAHSRRVLPPLRAGAGRLLDGGRARGGLRAMAEAKEAAQDRTVETKLGIRIERNPSEARLQELGVRSWPKWGCPPSEFPWTYRERETCFLLAGRVRVTPAAASEGVEFGAGDLVQFPAGMACTWTVAEAVDKHYLFEEEEDE